MQKIVVVMILGSFAYMGGLLVYSQFHVEPYISYGQLGEWIIGIVGFVVLVLTMKKDLINIRDRFKEYVEKQDERNSEFNDRLRGVEKDVSEIKGHIGNLWRRGKGMGN